MMVMRINGNPHCQFVTGEVFVIIFIAAHFVACGKNPTRLAISPHFQKAPIGSITPCRAAPERIFDVFY
jgi:hypothetical protein